MKEKPKIVCLHFFIPKLSCENTKKTSIIGEYLVVDKVAFIGRRVGDDPTKCHIIFEWTFRGHSNNT